MLSFRLASEEVAEVDRWAERLGVRRSEMIRESLRRYLNWLASEGDAGRWQAEPLSAEEMSLAETADWGVAEDWSDWSDETR